MYFLLLDRKRRRPAQEDDTEIVLRGNSQNMDPPRKRTDVAKANRYAVGSIADGSPINPRKTYGYGGSISSRGFLAFRRNSRQGRHSSLGGSPTESPRNSVRDLFSSTTGNGTFSARTSEERSKSSTRCVLFPPPLTGGNSLEAPTTAIITTPSRLILKPWRRRQDMSEYNGKQKRGKQRKRRGRDEVDEIVEKLSRRIP